MSRPLSGVLLCTAVTLCVACSGNRRDDQCDDVILPCSEGGVQRCNDASSAIEICVYDVDGCRQWQQAESCGSGVCIDTGPLPRCDDDECENECDELDETRCSGRTIESCTRGDDGCLDWVIAEDCSDADQGCSETSGEAQCVEGCGDECEPHDADRCNGTRIEHCGEESSGCWIWEEVEDCATAGEVCDDSGAAVACVAGCDDSCPVRTATQCAANVIQTCETGGDGCLAWTDGRDCEDDGLFCNDEIGAAECTDSCSDECAAEGTSQCLGNVIQSCNAGAGGCRYWIDGVDCATADQLCDAASGEARCVDSCTDTCPSAGDSQCAGTTIQTCGVGPLGCLAWLAGINCADAGQICTDADGAGAVCADSCTDDCPDAADTRCVGNMLQTCESSPAGCLTWTDTTDCEAAGDLCVVAGSDASCMCFDECSDTETRCSGDVVQACELVDGCWSWADSLDCGAHGYPCDDTSGTASCLSGSGDSCADPIAVLAFPYSARGGDFGADFTDSQTFTHSSCEDRSGEPEAIFVVTVAAGATLVMMELDAIDVAISVQSTCDPTGSCELSVDDLPGGGLRYTAPTAGTYYIIVEESYRGGAAYEIVIDIIEPEDCSDGVDNDGDGAVDCDDSDCFGHPAACTSELNCADGADNDDDGDTDCDDSDCTGVPSCLPYQGIYESFAPREAIDLGGTSIVFTPDAAAPDGFTWAASSITDFLVTPGSGIASTVLTLGDDDFELYSLVNMVDFEFYGVAYTSWFVSSNGYVTFDSGDDDYSPTTADFFAQPVIAGLWTDLNPGAPPGGGTVTVDDSPDRVVVTFEGVPRFGDTDVNDFQIVLNSHGGIAIAIVTAAAPATSRSTYTGIGSGTGRGAYPAETDFVP